MRFYDLLPQGCATLSAAGPTAHNKIKPRVGIGLLIAVPAQISPRFKVKTFFSLRDFVVEKNRNNCFPPSDDPKKVFS